MTRPDGPDLTVAYRRNGGLAGIELATTVHGVELTHEDAAVARRLLTDPPTTGSARSAAGRSDQFDHRLTLSEGAARRSFHWADADVPDDARALLAVLLQRAEPTR